MKKILAFALAVIMLLTMVACGAKKAPAYEGTMSDLLNAIYEKNPLDIMLMDNTPVDTNDADLLLYYAGVPNGADVSEVYYSEAAINIDPYIMAAIRVADDKDGKTVAQDVLDACDPGRWVCVRPEAVRVGQYGNVIVMVMGSTEVADGMMNAFAQVVGADLDSILQK